jgi:hypothetical protein
MELAPHAATGPGLYSWDYTERGVRGDTLVLVGRYI